MALKQDAVVRAEGTLKHDPEKWKPVFGKRSCSNNKLERDDDSKKSHHALTRKEAASLLGMNDTEFALRLIWDSRFPKPVRGVFRAADIRAWHKKQRAGAGKR